MASIASSKHSTALTALPETIQTYDEYKSLYKLSIEEPDRFWKMAAARLHWFRFPTRIKDTEFDYRTERGVEIKWYEDGLINVCYNCLDRHIEEDPNFASQRAIIFEPDTPSETHQHVTYGQLLSQVTRFANVLKKHGMKKGDRVTVYMPMVTEAVIVILACARLGAVHSVVFGGFSANSVAERISDCDSTLVVTSDFGVRGGKCIALKSKIDQALTMSQCKSVRNVLVFQRALDPKDDCANQRSSLAWTDGRDFWVHEELKTVQEDCPCEPMNAEDPLFIVSETRLAGNDRRRGRSILVVHERFNWETQGSSTYDRWLSHLHQSHLQICLRLQARRGVHVHCRRGLDHRTFV